MFLFANNLDYFQECILLLTIILFIVYFRIRIFRSIFLMIFYYLFFTQDIFLLLSLSPLIACYFIQDKYYFYTSYCMISSLHFFLAPIFVVNFTAWTSLSFLFLNLLLVSSDFAMFHKATLFFKRNYHVAEIFLKSAEEGYPLLIELPHIVALNISCIDGLYQVKYLLPISKNIDELRKKAKQVEFILHSKLGETKIKIQKIDIKDLFSRKFHEFKKSVNSTNYLDFFKTLSNKFPLKMDLFVCYEKIRSNGEMVPFDNNWALTSNSVMLNKNRIQAQQLESLNWQEKTRSFLFHDYLVKARVFLSIEKQKGKENPVFKNEIFNLKSRLFLYHKIFTKKICLNKLTRASDFLTTRALLPQIKEYEDLFLAPDRNRGNSILLGFLIESSRETNRPYNFNIDDFAKGAMILGSPGTGKTFLQGHIVKEITRKRKDVGILVLNLTKSGQHKFYPHLEVLEMKDFKIPYFPPCNVREFPLERTILAMESARYIAGSLGLKNVLETIIYDVLLREAIPPKTIKDLFKLVLLHLKEKPYDNRLTLNFMQAIQNRLSAFLDTGLMNNFSLIDQEYPKWFKEWIDGKSFFVNLKAPQNVQRFAIFALLNLIRYRFSGEEVNHLRNLIMIDEAHVLSGSPPHRMSVDDDEMVTFNVQTQIFSNLINEFRSRGVSIVLADQREETLEFAKTTGLKIFFRSRITGEYLEENLLKLISRLKNRHTIVLSENEVVHMKTPDFEA